MDKPTTDVHTEWGSFYATARDGDTVRFRTAGSNDANPERQLKLHRLRYSSEFTMTRREQRRTVRYSIDDVWHVDISEVGYRLRRYPSGGPATSNAQVMLRQAVLPKLASWLSTPEGARLLELGAGGELERRVEEIDLADRVLGHALDRVRELQSAVRAGGSVGDEDHRFVRFVITDLHAAEQREAPAPRFRPAAEFFSDPTPQPEIPGL